MPKKVTTPAVTPSTSKPPPGVDPDRNAPGSEASNSYCKPGYHYCENISQCRPKGTSCPKGVTKAGYDQAYGECSKACPNGQLAGFDLKTKKCVCKSEYKTRTGKDRDILSMGNERSKVSAAEVKYQAENKAATETKQKLQAQESAVKSGASLNKQMGQWCADRDGKRQGEDCCIPTGEPGKYNCVKIPKTGIVTKAEEAFNTLKTMVKRKK